MKVLIIIDMLNDFIRKEGALYCGESAANIVPFIFQRLATYRRAGDVVIYLCDAHEPDDKEFTQFPPHCLAGTWGGEIIGELAPRSGETVLAKTRYSGFYNTPLARMLEEVKPEVVEVVGVCTSICVMDMVGGLANRDHTVQVPGRGVADLDPRFHKLALERMHKLYGARIL